MKSFAAAALATFVIASAFAQVQVVPSLTVNDLDVTVPTAIGAFGDTVKLKAIVKSKTNQQPVAGGNVTFKVAGQPAGNATTDGTGLATVDFKVPTSFPPGANALEASCESGAHRGSGTGNFDAVKVLTTLTLAAGYMKDGQFVHGNEAPDGGEISVRGALKRGTDKAGPEGREIKIRRNGQVVATVMTSNTGAYDYRWNLAPGGGWGTYAFEAAFEGDNHYLATKSPSDSLKERPKPKGILYSEIDKTKLVKGKVINIGDAVQITGLVGHTWVPGKGVEDPQANVSVRFVLGFGETASGDTYKSNGDGVVVGIVRPQHAGYTPVHIKITDAYWLDGMSTAVPNPVDPGFASLDFDVAQWGTEVHATAPASGISGKMITVHARLTSKHDDKPLPNRKIQVGNYSATTNGNGECDVQVKLDASFGAGPRPVKALFAGEQDYAASSDTVTVNIKPNDN